MLFLRVSVSSLAIWDANLITQQCPQMGLRKILHLHHLALGLLRVYIFTLPPTAAAIVIAIFCSCWGYSSPETVGGTRLVLNCWEMLSIKKWDVKGTYIIVVSSAQNERDEFHADTCHHHHTWCKKIRRWYAKCREKVSMQFAPLHTCHSSIFAQQLIHQVSCPDGRWKPFFSC